MLYLGNVLLRYVLLYNLKVSFNFHSTFLQLNVIKNAHCVVKTVFFLTLGYFNFRAPCGGTCKDISSRSLIFAGAAWIKLSKGSNKRIEYDSQEKLIRDGQR